MFNGEPISAQPWADDLGENGDDWALALAPIHPDQAGRFQIAQRSLLRIPAHSKAVELPVR